MTRPHLTSLAAIAAVLLPLTAVATDDDPKATLDRMCTVATEVERDPTLTRDDRALVLAQRLAQAMTSRQVAELFETLAVAPPEARLRLFRDGVRELGVTSWSCAPLERAFSPPRG